MKYFFAFITFFFFSCNQNQLFVTYNVQNLFDDQLDGSEYREFTNAEQWTTVFYQQKLLNIAQVIDLVATENKGKLTLLALQEIENEGVVANLIAHTKSLTGYHSAFVKGQLANGQNQPTGVALISRYPIIQIEKWDSRLWSVASRPILSAQVALPSGALQILVCHLPSRSSDPLGTHKQQAFKVIQNYVEELQITNPNLPILLMGDMNGDSPKDLFFSTEATSGGSYFFRGEWEQIDHILFSPHWNNKIVSYSVFSHPLLLKDEIPYRWNNYNAKGYSDHLPVILGVKAG